MMQLAPIALGCLYFHTFYLSSKVNCFEPVAFLAHVVLSILLNVRWGIDQLVLYP